MWSYERNHLCMKKQKPKAARPYPVEEPDTLLPFLLGAVQDKSRNTVKNLLARGQVQVDGTTVTQYNHPLTPGQTVTIQPERTKTGNLPFPILWEDAHILVVDKPAGLLSMASDTERERTAYRQAMDYVRAEDPGRRIFIVHRLDRDTSGVLLFAKDEDTKRALQEHWEERVCRRGYTALAEGVPPKQADTIRSLLRENAAHKVYSVPFDGKEAVTHYRTIRVGKRYSLLDVEIATGRKNQIRAHLSELGCPIAGDRTYGAATDPLRRLCLHAQELVLRYPTWEETVTFRAELPRGFARLV